MCEATGLIFSTGLGNEGMGDETRGENKVQQEKCLEQSHVILPQHSHPISNIRQVTGPLSEPATKAFASCRGLCGPADDAHRGCWGEVG